MVVYKKVHIEKSWEDIPANFPPLPNLHLDMLEDKAKLRKDLPPIPLPTYKGGAMNAPQMVHSPSDRSDESVPASPIRSYPPTPGGRFTGPPTPVDAHRGSHRGGSHRGGSHRDYDSGGDDLLDALGVHPREAPRPRQAPATPPPELGGETPATDAPAPHTDEAELNENGETPEEMESRIEEERHEYMVKLKMLRKRCPELQLPPYSEHSTHGELKRIYDDGMRELAIAHNFENYKGYLMGGFLLTEFVCTQFFSIDMSGYAQVQITQMSKYDQLLFELGEKSYMGFGSSLPVELRLVGLILFNAAVFYIVKLVEQKGGESAGALFKSLFGAHVASSQPAAAPAQPARAAPTRAAPAKKRRGPSISVDEIRDLDD